MYRRQADEGNWQARGQEFAVGQSVRMVNGGATDEGRVVAVWPGIGMVDVEFPHTNYRMPVESLQIVSPGEDYFVTPLHETVPGGARSLGQVPEGAFAEDLITAEEPRVEMVHEVGPVEELRKRASRVVRAFVKKSLYWHARDRKYRVSREEHDNGSYHCPIRGCEGHLRRATYKMRDGAKVKLYACPTCLFMIRASDLLTDHCEPEEVC
jgi:hypothetical protein